VGKCRSGVVTTLLFGVVAVAEIKSWQGKGGRCSCLLQLACDGWGRRSTKEARHPAGEHTATGRSAPARTIEHVDDGAALFSADVISCLVVMVENDGRLCCCGGPCSRAAYIVLVHVDIVIPG
jgi:hypothetical protein